jgi:hypothetical protein
MCGIGMVEISYEESSEMTAAAMSESQTSHLGAELRRRLPHSFVLELTAKEYVEVKGDG